MSSRIAGRTLNLAREVCYNGGFLREPPAKSVDTQGGTRQLAAVRLQLPAVRLQLPWWEFR